MGAFSRAFSFLGFFVASTTATVTVSDVVVTSLTTSTAVVTAITTDDDAVTDLTVADTLAV